MRRKQDQGRQSGGRGIRSVVEGDRGWTEEWQEVAADISSLDACYGDMNEDGVSELLSQEATGLFIGFLGSVEAGGFSFFLGCLIEVEIARA